MVRQSFEDQVSEPGRYEGEAPWVPYFWEKFEAGHAHEIDEDRVSFVVLEEDWEVFPELNLGALVRLLVREDGSVTELALPAEATLSGEEDWSELDLSGDEDLASYGSVFFEGPSANPSDWGGDRAEELRATGHYEF